MPTQWPANWTRERWLEYWETADREQWQGDQITAEAMAEKDLPAAVAEIRLLDTEVKRLRQANEHWHQLVTHLDNDIAASRDNVDAANSGAPSDQGSTHRGLKGEAMNWRESLPLGSADATEQQEAWTEVKRLRKALQVIIDQGVDNYRHGSVWYERIAKAALDAER